jgi:hypothetical protein
MKVYVNNQEVNLTPEMTVRHALTAAGLIDAVKGGKRVYDEMSNEIGLGGALTEGARIYLRDGRPIS